MQDFFEIDESYKNPDPWGYQTSPEDARRKALILERLSKYGKFERALDIGAGEGWITKDLPAKIIHGYEVSTNAAMRFPNNVFRVLNPLGFYHYDLIIATGVMYAHYDYQNFIAMIKTMATHIVLLCNIKEWEVPEVGGIPHQIHEEEFPYREFTEKLRIYDFAPQHRKEVERELQHAGGNPGVFRPSFV